MGVQLSDEGALSTGAVAAAPFIAGATAGLVRAGLYGFLFGGAACLERAATPVGAFQILVCSVTDAALLGLERSLVDLEEGGETLCLAEALKMSQGAFTTGAQRENLKCRMAMALSSTASMAQGCNREMIYGIRGYYKGLSVVMLTSCPAFGVYYLTYEASKSKLGSTTGWSPDAIHLLSGAVANVFGMVIWTPQEVIKSQTQVQIGASMSPRAVIRDIYRENGIRGFYRGAVIGSLTWTPLSAIWFMSYERLRLLSCCREELAKEGSCSAGRLAASGFIAGVIACIATSPIDVVKTQYQVAGRGIASSSSAAIGASSVPMIALALLRSEGVGGFFRGVWAKSLWYGTFMAINITVYDTVKLSLQGSDC